MFDAEKEANELVSRASTVGRLEVPGVKIGYVRQP
jgi:hypothetical protein